MQILERNLTPFFDNYQIRTTWNVCGRGVCVWKRLVELLTEGRRNRNATHVVVKICKLLHLRAKLQAVSRGGHEMLSVVAVDRKKREVKWLGDRQARLSEVVWVLTCFKEQFHGASRRGSPNA